MRQQGRHRVPEAEGHGRHRDPTDREVAHGCEGRHRPDPFQPRDVSPLVTAGAGVAAAVLTAIVLSSAQGPLGAPLQEREQEQRPTSASPREGAPTATESAGVDTGYSAGAGGGGIGVHSNWDVLLERGPGEPSLVLALLLDDGPGTTPSAAESAGAGSEAGSGPTPARDEVQPTATGGATSTPPSTSTGSASAAGSLLVPESPKPAPVPDPAIAAGQPTAEVAGDDAPRGAGGRPTKVATAPEQSVAPPVAEEATRSTAPGEGNGREEDGDSRARDEHGRRTAAVESAPVAKTAERGTEAAEQGTEADERGVETAERVAKTKTAERLGETAEREEKTAEREEKTAEPKRQPSREVEPSGEDRSGPAEDRSGESGRSPSVELPD